MSKLMTDPFTIQLPKWFGESVPVEEFAEEGALVVRAELPGIDPEKDIEISVHQGVLHIKGERSERKATTDKAFYRSEFRYGMFERRVALPSGATDKDVKATYHDGVLEVRIPLAVEESPVTKIPVQRT